MKKQRRKPWNPYSQRNNELIFARVRVTVGKRKRVTSCVLVIRFHPVFGGELYFFPEPGTRRRLQDVVQELVPTLDEMSSWPWMLILAALFTAAAGIVLYYRVKIKAYFTRVKPWLERTDSRDLAIEAEV